ncbi:MAG: hypothetical protein CMJ31_03610 [Phycisphaerae bacterium]|nr:hypothetical protein [Phycisphaerae bacterium]
MPITPEEFNERLSALREELHEQGRRARRLAQTTFDAFIQHDPEQAREAIRLDDEIDEVDVDLERRLVELLVEAAREAISLDERPIRGALTLVKVNNEFERIADAGVSIAHNTIAMPEATDAFPPTARVMTNSVVGMLRDIAKAYGERDASLARLVLQSEDIVGAFKQEILRQAERQVASGAMSVDVAFHLHELANACTLMADHATNIAEQVIYDATGAIVRHMEGHWVLDDLK